MTRNSTRGPSGMRLPLALQVKPGRARMRPEPSNVQKAPSRAASPPAPFGGRFLSPGAVGTGEACTAGASQRRGPPLPTCTRPGGKHHARSHVLCSQGHQLEGYALKDSNYDVRGIAREGRPRVAGSHRWAPWARARRMPQHANGNRGVGSGLLDATTARGGAPARLPGCQAAAEFDDGAGPRPMRQPPSQP